MQALSVSHVAFLLALLTGASSFPVTAAAQSAAAEQVQTATRQRAAGDLEAATRTLRDALFAAPEDTRVLRELANVLLEQRASEEGISFLQEAAR
jgi:Tfp pilus assembly protein PilF